MSYKSITGEIEVCKALENLGWQTFWTGLSGKAIDVIAIKDKGKSKRFALIDSKHRTIPKEYQEGGSRAGGRGWRIQEDWVRKLRKEVEFFPKESSHGYFIFCVDFEGRPGYEFFVLPLEKLEEDYAILRGEISGNRNYYKTGKNVVWYNPAGRRCREHTLWIEDL